MATKVVMEALSPTMEEGRLVKWLKNEGDQIATGDVLAEVETDKAVMELAARGEGVLRKRLAEEGGTAPVGSLIAVIAAPDENIDELLAEAGGGAAEGEPEKAAAPAAPDKAEAGASGDAEKPAVPADAEESQGEASTPPPSAATAEAPAAPEGGAKPPAPPARPRQAAAPRTGAPPTDGRERSSPLARRLASEQGLELSELKGSGPGGRIIKRDVESAIAAGAAAPERGGKAAKERPRRFISREGDYQDIPLSQMRKTIARRLAESLGPVPTFYLTAEFDMRRATEMREALQEMGDEFKLSFNDIVLKALAMALSDHPEVNAHWMGDRIRHFNRVHVGMAVAIEEGLITPVIFAADTKSLPEISAEARELAALARKRKLTPEQYTGSTFSISNLGMFGIEHFTAIINPPEAGILAVGAVEDTPVVHDGALSVRPRMRVTMSCDHRVVDGATGAKFLQTLKRLVENPLSLVYPPPE